MPLRTRFEHLVVATEHKSLLGVLNNWHLGDIKNELVLSVEEKTLSYPFSFILIPGQKQKTSDANSRKHTGDAKNLTWIAIWKSRVYRFHLPEATMTWEPDTSADLEEKLACRCFRFQSLRPEFGLMFTICKSNLGRF